MVFVGLGESAPTTTQWPTASHGARGAVDVVGRLDNHTEKRRIITPSRGPWPRQSMSRTAGTVAVPPAPRPGRYFRSTLLRVSEASVTPRPYRELLNAAPGVDQAGRLVRWPLSTVSRRSSRYGASTPQWNIMSGWGSPLGHIPPEGFRIPFRWRRRSARGGVAGGGPQWPRAAGHGLAEGTRALSSLRVAMGSGSARRWQCDRRA